MKRILSLLLTVILTLSLFPAAAYAAPGWPADVAIEADQLPVLSSISVEAMT